MKRRQNEGHLASAKMKRKQDNSDEVSAGTERRQHEGNLAFTKMKRKQDNNDEGLDEVVGFTKYRTGKRRKGVTKEDPESSPSTSSCSDNSEANSSSSLDSWDLDNESPTELPEGEPEKSSACAAQEVVGNLKKQEVAVLEDLDHFWSSKVAAKARKELGKLSKSYFGKNITSPEVLNTRCSDVKKLMELPCVVSVGLSKDSKVRVFVSDQNKAVELSEQLKNPNIQLVEARNSHLM